MRGRSSIVQSDGYIELMCVLVDAVTRTTPPPRLLFHAAAVEERCSSPVGMKRWLLPPWSLIDAKGDAPLMSTRPSGCTRKA